VRHAGLERGPQSQSDVGILGGIFGGSVERHLVEADRLLPASAHLLEGQALMVEMLGGEIVH
jgi:hypothetical protein